MNDLSFNKTVNNKNKESLFIVGDSMIKSVNGFLITRKIGHKQLVKVRSFSCANVEGMYDYIKPTLRECDPESFIVHIGTNELNTAKTASQISRSIIDFQTI